jgi:hypothetical protein
MIPSMFRCKKTGSLNEFAILGVFVAVVCLGLVFALLQVGMGIGKKRAVSEASVPTPPPTLGEYQSDASSIMAPFLSQAKRVTVEDFGATDSAPIAELVQKTQERLLRLRIPREARDIHLEFVLFLDQWQRALIGSVADQRRVIANTELLFAKYPWLAE